MFLTCQVLEKPLKPSLIILKHFDMTLKPDLTIWKSHNKFGEIGLLMLELGGMCNEFVLLTRQYLSEQTS